MSFAIATVGTLNAAATQQVSSGSITSGQAVVTSTDQPVVAGGNATVALGTTNAKVVLTGDAQLGIAKDANGNPINIGGASIVAEDKGSKVLNLNGADVSGATVDKSELPKTGAVPSDQTFNTFTLVEIMRHHFQLFCSEKVWDIEKDEAECVRVARLTHHHNAMAGCLRCHRHGR